MTELFLFGSKPQHDIPSTYFSISILGNLNSPTPVVRNLGVLFDSDFSFTITVAEW